MRKINLYSPLFLLTLFFLVLGSCQEEKSVSTDKKKETMAQQIPEIPSGAIHCISGLTYLILEEGEGNERPGPEDLVRAVIESYTENEIGNNDIQTLILNEKGDGLAEAFQLMTPKQKIRVWIPALLQKDSVSDLVVYDLELIDFKRMKEPPTIRDSFVSPSM